MDLDDQVPENPKLGSFGLGRSHAEIFSGTWTFPTLGLVLKDGRLLDGQHRIVAAEAVLRPNEEDAS